MRIIFVDGGNFDIELVRNLTIYCRKIRVTQACSFNINHNLQKSGIYNNLA